MRKHFNGVCGGSGLSDEGGAGVSPSSIDAEAVNVTRVLRAIAPHRNIAVSATSASRGGRDLFDLLQREGALGESRSRAITRQLLRAVAHCHAANVVHRDIKLQNVLLNDALQVRLAGFGIAHIGGSGDGAAAAAVARPAAPNGSASGTVSSAIVASSVAVPSRLKSAFETLFEFDDGDELTEPCGTSYYVAPEVLRLRYSRSCDLWSVGVVLYCLLAGFPPFNGASEEAILEQVKHGVLSFAHDAWRSTSESAKELVRLLLTRDRHKRISAAAALRHPWLEADPLESARLKLQHGQISQREYEHLETLLLRDPTFERHEASRGAALRQETEALAREVGAVRDALREGQRSHEAMVQQLRDAWESERSALDQRAAQLSARLNALQKPRS
jgi:serine/threonine protein kinase